MKTTRIRTAAPHAEPCTYAHPCYSKAVSCLLILVLLCGILSSAVGCSSNQTDTGVSIPADMKAVASEAADYDLVVPTSWLVETTVGMTSVYVEDRVRSNVSVCANEIRGEISSIEAYWDLFTEQFTASFADFTMLDTEPVNVTVGSAYEDNATDGYKYRYTATVGDVKYQWMQVLFIRNATLYILTYTSTADVYEDHLEDVNDIIAYFSFR